jgi:hypothetical protein
MRMRTQGRWAVLAMGATCFLGGYLAGQVGPLRLHAQEPPAGGGTRSFTNLLGNVLAVRGLGETGFTDKTQRYGIEVYRDERHGTLLYITETGAIAAVPAPNNTPADR